MKDDTLWQAKHWGLAIASIMSVGGLFLAAPGTAHTWKKFQGQEKFLVFNYEATKILKYDEPDPVGYKPKELIVANKLKPLGTSLMLLGSTVLVICANTLKKEYERLEYANHMVRRSEFELADHEYQQSVEVDRWAIDLEYQGQISSMLQPPTEYYPQEDEQKVIEPGLSRTSNGFFAFLLEKSETMGNTFEVRWCCQQSFAGSKSKIEEVKDWVGELVQNGQAEWLDDEQKTFRLLNC